MYLHCHECGWDNGDFGYDYKYFLKEAFREMWPLRLLHVKKRINKTCWWPIVIPTWKKDKWGNKLYLHLHKTVWIDPENKIHFGSLVFIPFIADFKKAWWTFKNQKYKTFDEFKLNNPQGICPKCGKSMLDID